MKQILTDFEGIEKEIVIDDTAFEAALERAIEDGSVEYD